MTEQPAAPVETRAEDIGPQNLGKLRPIAHRFDACASGAALPDPDESVELMDRVRTPKS